MKKDFKLFRRGVLLSSLVSALCISTPQNISALSHQFGDDIGLDVDVSLTYGAAWRLKNPDAAGLSNINADDGNRNFEKGDLVNNRITVIADMDLHKGDYGLFIRPKFFYDWAYNGSNANNSPFTNNNSFENGGSTNFNEFSDSTKDVHRDKGEILDAFLYGAHSFGNTETMLRIGRQAVNWGESLFILQGINGATAYLDTTQANVPGVEVRELLLPTEQVYGEVTTGSLTIAGFYQWQWEKNRLDESGSFFSTTDQLDNAGERILVQAAPNVNASADRGIDEDAKDSGQFGAAVRYNAESLNDTEFGLYFVNYHEKMPILRESFGSGGSPSPTMAALGGDWGNAVLNAVDMSSYSLEYVEDVKLLGASFSGIIGETNIAGEMSYRFDMPIPFADATSPLLGVKYERSDYFQGQISAISVFPASPVYDAASITFEAGILHILDNKDLAVGKDHTSFGGQVKFTFDYFQIIKMVDLKVPLTLKWSPSGSSPILGTFAEKSDSVSIGLDFFYKDVYGLSLAYTEFLHGVEDNPIADRDFVSASLKYTF